MFGLPLATRTPVACTCIIFMSFAVAPKVFADAPKVLPQPSKPVSLNKSGKSWLPVIIWLVVVAVSVAYRFAMDRKIAVRELPRDTDIFLVSYPKSGETELLFQAYIVYLFLLVGRVGPRLGDALTPHSSRYYTRCRTRTKRKHAGASTEAQNSGSLYGVQSKPAQHSIDTATHANTQLVSRHTPV